jgi:MOSC domain-containing protein YiiM
MLTLRELTSRSAGHGRLQWIGIRPARRAPMFTPESAELLTQRGLVGDRAAEKQGGARQVTLVQAEHLRTIALFLAPRASLGREAVDPGSLRRNLVVSGINLLSLRLATFRIGSSVLQGTGHCHPCSRLEESLGFGGYNAARGLGGITARVLEGGRIQLDDAVELLQGQSEALG